MAELRHDFRHEYGAPYDEVPTAEAIDLIETLPPGSLYVAAKRPWLAWSPERSALADVVDAVMLLAWGMGVYDRDAVPEPPRVTRPEDVAERARAREAADRARSAIDQTVWEEV